MSNSRPHSETGSGSTASRPWWLGFLVIAAGCVCLYGALSLPQTARYAGIGPGVFVTFVGTGLVILGLLLLVQISRGERFIPQDTEDASGEDKAHIPALLTALAAAVVPVLTIRHLGVPITATLSFALVARSFGSSGLFRDIITGAILGSVAWFLFTRLGLQIGGFLPIAGF